MSVVKPTFRFNKIHARENYISFALFSPSKIETRYGGTRISDYPRDSCRFSAHWMIGACRNDIKDISRNMIYTRVQTAFELIPLIRKFNNFLPFAKEYRYEFLLGLSGFLGL